MIRTARLAIGNAIVGSNTLFTVPAGEHWRVREAEFDMAGAGTLSLLVVPSGGTARSFFRAAPAAAGIVRYDGTVVLEAGDALRLTLAVSGSAFVVSGTKYTA